MGGFPLAKAIARVKTLKVQTCATLNNDAKLGKLFNVWDVDKRGVAEATKTVPISSAKVQFLRKVKEIGRRKGKRAMLVKNMVCITKKNKHTHCCVSKLLECH